MRKVTTTDKRTVMTRAWTFFRANRFGTFSDCLRLAWADLKKVNEAKAQFTEPAMRYIDWQNLGRDVAHGMTALFKVVLTDAKTKNGTRVVPFFGYTQTVAIGWNE